MLNIFKFLSKLLFIHNDTNKQPDNFNTINEQSYNVFKFNFEGRKLTIHDISVGDEVSFWYKPDSDWVHFYILGYTLGDGFIGKISSTTLQKIYPKENYKLSSKIKSIYNNCIELEENLIIINYIEQARKHYNKLGETLLQRYTPKSTIKIGFKLDSSVFGWRDDIRLNHCLSVNIINEFKEKQEIEILKSSIWLEGKNQEKISTQNLTENSELYRLVRVLISNHKTRLSYIKKRNHQKYQYDSEVVYWYVDIEL
jgi:hypothetical protein